MTARSLEDMLATWRLAMSRDYAAGIEGTSGEDLVAALAAMFSEASRAIDVTMQSLYTLPHWSQTSEPASGARQASTTLLLERAAGVGRLDFEVVLPEGTVVIAHQPGSRGRDVLLPDFQLAQDVRFLSGDGAPRYVPAVARQVGTSANVRPGCLDSFLELGRLTVLGTIEDARTIAMSVSEVLFDGRTEGRYVQVSFGDRVSFHRVDGIDGAKVLLGSDLPADLVSLLAFVEITTVEWADLGVTVSQPLPAQGGLFGVLDAIAGDRGIGRHKSEVDDSLSARVVTVADTVTVPAVLRLCQQLLGIAGLRYQLAETGDTVWLRGLALDWDAYDVGSLALAGTVPGRGQGLVLLSRDDSVTFFIVRVSNSNEGDFGFAYDVESSAPPFALDVSALDGAPLRYYSRLAQFSQAVDSLRSAGVQWQLVQDFTL